MPKASDFLDGGTSLGSASDFLDAPQPAPRAGLFDATPTPRTVGAADSKDRRPTVSGPAASVVNQLTFGLAEEAAGAGSYLGRLLRNATRAPIERIFGVDSPEVTPGQAYDNTVAAERGNLHSFEESSPVLSRALEAGGALAMGAPTTVLAPGGAAVAPVAAIPRGAASFAKSVGQSAALGGGMGAAQGFGDTEGGLGDRLQGAAKGGALGMLVGGAVPVVATAGAKVGGKTLDFLNLRDGDRAAVNQLLRAFERDGIPADQAVQRLQEWQANGATPAMLFDLGGENVKSTARAVMSVPGTARNVGMQAIEGRNINQPGRVADALATELGDDAARAPYRGTFEELAAKRSAEAAPLYKEAFSNRAPIYNDRIAAFTQHPDVATGIRRGLRIQRDEALARNQPFDPHEYGIVDFNEAGDPVMGPVLNLRALDAGKRGLDDILQQPEMRNPLTGKLTERGRALDEIRRAYLGELDAATGGPEGSYARARAAFAGPTRSMEALQMGRRIFRTDPESAIDVAEIRRLAPGDQEFFRQGAVQAIRDKMATVSDVGQRRDMVKSFFRNDAMRSRLRAAFPDDASFGRFERAMRQEIEAFDNGAFVSPRTNSPTARIQQDVADMERDPVTGLLGTFAESYANGATAGGSALRAIRQSEFYRRGQGMSSSTADAMAPYLFDSGNLPSLLQVLVDRDLLNRTNHARRAPLARGLVGRLGQSAGAIATSGD